MSLVEQGKRPQRHTSRQILKVGIATALRIDAAEPTHDRSLKVLDPDGRLEKRTYAVQQKARYSIYPIGKRDQLLQIDHRIAVSRLLAPSCL